MRHEPVELMPALVPLDTVERVPAQVVAAGQVRRLSLLDELGNADTEVWKAVDHWKEEKNKKSRKVVNYKRDKKASAEFDLSIF